MNSIKEELAMQVMVKVFGKAALFRLLATISPSIAQEILGYRNITDRGKRVINNILEGISSGELIEAWKDYNEASPKEKELAMRHKLQKAGYHILEEETTLRISDNLGMDIEDIPKSAPSPPRDLKELIVQGSVDDMEAIVKKYIVEYLKYLEKHALWLKVVSLRKAIKAREGRRFVEIWNRTETELENVREMRIRSYNRIRSLLLKHMEV